VRDARIFRKPIDAAAPPTSDIISLDGDGWLTVDGLVGWAGRADGGARLEVVNADGRALIEVGDDLTSRSRRALPSTTIGDGGQSWVAAVSDAHVVWAATLENDPVFAVLALTGDATAMQPTSGVVRLRHATLRTTIVSPGERSWLVAWSESDNVVRYSIVQW
jgi:hypothetical protein